MELSTFDLLMQIVPMVFAVAFAWWSLSAAVKRNSEELRQLRSDNHREHEQLVHKLEAWSNQNTREHDQLGSSVSKLRDDLNELDKQNSLEHEKLKNGTL